MAVPFLSLVLFSLAAPLLAPPTSAVPVNVYDGAHRSPRSSGPALLNEDKCYSSTCNRTAAYLEKAIDPLADPCENFYKFTCGNFIRDTKLSPHQTEVTVITQMQEKVQRQLRDVLSEAIDKDDVKAFKVARTLYQSCVDTARLEELGLGPGKQILSALGGWPVLIGDSWEGENFDWIAMLYKLREKGLDGDYLFKVGVVPVMNESSLFYVLLIDSPVLHLDLMGYDESSATKRFEEYVNLTTSVAMMFDPLDGNRTRVREEMTKMVSLEREINAQMPSLEDRRHRTRGAKLIPLGRLSEVLPYFPWKPYVDDALPAGVNVSDDELVAVQPMYLEGLGNVLSNAENRTLANYLVWRALRKHGLPQLNAASRALVVEYITGRAAQGRERWKDCVTLVQERARVAASALYARRFSSPEVLANARMLVEDISKDMSRLVEAADWMHSEAKSSAKLKADNLQFIIGYPMDLLNDTFLDAQYKQYNNLAVDSFLHNMMVVHKQIEEETFRKYRSEFKGADYTSVNAMVVEVNAYYVPNVLGLPLGILQEPVFNSERPQYMNYGGIGYVIGHESSHGFDENGRLVNHNGTLEMWWDEDTLSSFQEKVRCMVEQYSNITNKDTNVTVNGVLTQSENIADNVGIKLAYRAYQRHVAAHGPEPRIPLRFPDGSSLELSPNQMFWVSFAYFQCAKLSPQELDRTMRTEHHVPSMHRANAVLNNQEAFASDFLCPAGSPMNPVHKCQVW